MVFNEGGNRADKLGSPVEKRHARCLRGSKLLEGLEDNNIKAKLVDVFADINRSIVKITTEYKKPNATLGGKEPLIAAVQQFSYRIRYRS